MMKIYLFGYSLGFVSGLLAYRWWLLGKNEKVVEGKMEIGKYKVNVQHDPVTEGIIVHVENGKDNYVTLRYSKLESVDMTIDKLERLIKEHFKKNDIIHGSNT